MSAIVEKMEGDLHVIICNKCVYNNKNGTCKAFPNKIPKKVWIENNHDNIIEFQEGNFVFKNKNY